MSLHQVSSPFDLLGQAQPPAASPRLSGDSAPQLDVAWGSFHQGIGSSIAALFTGAGALEKSSANKFFKDSWIERRIPRRAVAAAALWHVAFLLMPFPQLPAAAHKFSAFDNTQLTWSGSINDLPLLDMQPAKTKPTPRGEPNKPLPRQGADAFHPRQRIFTDPVHPNHPRQTLINSAAPNEPPKLLPNLPNIVQMQSLAAPARPRLQISQQTLAKLRPRERRHATTTSTPLPDLPTLAENAAAIPMPDAPNAPARPKLELQPGAPPRVAQHTQTGDAGPAPEVGAQSSGANANPSTFIAISATPGPPAPVQPPQGNLAARVSISPEGKQPGVPGGAPNGPAATNGGAGGNPESGGGEGKGGTGKNSIGISISGGNPGANNGISGLGGKLPSNANSSPRKLTARPDSHVAADDAPVRTGPPNFADLPPGAPPEQIFISKKVYKLFIDMPNLNSATGSWILNFSELRSNPSGPHVMSSELNGPVPLKKVDPKYPPSLISERVEGEVVLYAVIRRDGSVDSIELVHGIDEQLDANAMDALGHWKFQPAHRQGQAVELEAIVHIPFHLPESFR